MTSHGLSLAARANHGWGKVMGLDVLGDGVSLGLREARPLVDSFAISFEVVQS